MWFMLLIPALERLKQKQEFLWDLCVLPVSFKPAWYTPASSRPEGLSGEHKIARSFWVSDT